MRSSGVLLPIFSLPGAGGIGTLGKEALKFVDFLKDAGQRCWQILPVGPTGYGDSPYQSFCAFAGNPYLIDLELLCRDGLLLPDEIREEAEIPVGPVDYGRLFRTRFLLLEKAVSRLSPQKQQMEDFCRTNSSWLADYALFMAMKEENKNRAWQDWSEPLRLREPDAMEQARTRLAGRIFFWQAVQYLFFCQWNDFKAYANEQGISIIGDLPIYVSADSSDVWARSELFQMDENRRPAFVAGVPPDAFSTEGQLWGNPLYCWEKHRADGFAWWLQRLCHAAQIYDVTRIDHFRGFCDYYAIPAVEKTAQRGAWMQGPGMALIDAVRKELPQMKLIAEDLGQLHDGVRQLLKQSGLPGMKVLQFAFGSGWDNDYLPYRYPHNCVVYTGTHDNTTTVDWYQSAPKAEVEFACRYLDVGPEQDFCDSLIRAAVASVADTVIVPMADWLHLGAQARINTPSTSFGNWVWRMQGAQADHCLAVKMRELCSLYGRC